MSSSLGFVLLGALAVIVGGLIPVQHDFPGKTGVRHAW